MTVSIRLPENYPDRTPDILLTCSQLESDIVKAICQDALQYANQHLGEFIIFNVLQNIQENLNKSCESLSIMGDNSQSDSTSDVWNVVLLLDHMRAKSKYIKTIQKWTQELNIKGRLLFHGKLILILLQGDYSNIKVG